MTETQTAADQRWADAETRARAYLAQPRNRRVLPIRGFVLAVALTLALLVVISFTLPPGSDARLTLSAIGAGIAVLVLVAEVIRAIRFRRRAGLAVVRVQVLASLLQREQRAVSRAAMGTTEAPADRRIVVDAVATDLASGDGLPMLAGQLVVWTALAVSGVTFWPLYLVGVLVAAVQFVWTTRSAMLAQRYLAASPTS